MALIGLFVGMLVLAAAIIICVAVLAEEDRKPAATIAGVICVFILAITFGQWFGHQYSEVLGVEERIPMLTETIEQQTALLAGLDQSVGSGLEGLEIKRTIQQTIRDRNDLIATARIMRRSAWYVFKPAVVW